MTVSSPEPPYDQRITRSQLLHLSIGFTLALCLIATLLPLPFGRPTPWTFLSPSRLLNVQTLLYGLLGLLVGWLVAFLITHWRPLNVVFERLASLIAWEQLRFPDHLAIALMAAVGEESLFRAALQPLIGWLPAALIFGLLHATSLVHIGLATALGLGLGWLFQHTGNLWPVITAHVAIDLVTALVVAHHMRRGE